jgi:phytoene synthase
MNPPPAMVEAPATTDLTPNDAGYWVVRFAPATQRPALQAVLQWAAELERIVTRGHASSVTQLKLDWWREELANGDAARHPLAQALAALAAAPDSQAELQHLIDAAEARLRKQQPADPQVFRQQCDQGGAVARLLLQAVGVTDPTQLEQASLLGRYADAVRRIQQLGQYLQQEHNPLPANLLPHGDSAHWDNEVLGSACEQLLAPLYAAAQPLLHDSSRPLAPARRWAGQSHAVHRLLQREDYAVRRQYLDITPLARLWAAWRVR